MCNFVPNMIQSQLATIEYGSSSKTQLARHYLLTAGYKYAPPKAVFSTEPSILIRKLPSAPLQVDFTMKFGVLNDQFITAFTYGTSEIITLTAGYQIMKEGFIAYSFDYALGELYRYTKGSHEVSVIWEFGKRNFRYKKPSSSERFDK